MNATNQHRDTLLIIDDIPDNVSLLYHFLNKTGFKVLVASSGEEGIEMAAYVHPDLILLDVMMPDIDGFEVCRTLKSAERTKDIPIIFMTALTENSQKVKGFSLGAEDYITKPLQYEEVLARVNVRLNLRKQQRLLQEEIDIRRATEVSLQKTNKQLAERTSELQVRTEELEQRNLELDAFAHTVAHDLRNPLSAMVGLGELLLATYPPNSLVDTKLAKQLHLLVQAGEEMHKIIESLLLLAGVSKKADVDIEPLDMQQIVNQVIDQRIYHLLKRYTGKINLPESWPMARGYSPWVTEVWVNYLSNALKYGGHPPYLVLGHEMQADHKIRFWVQDNGPGISEEGQSRLFTPFTRLHQRFGEGHGLGLSIVKQIVEKLGGEVGVESHVGEGSLFFFTLPSYDKAVAK